MISPRVLIFIVSESIFSPRGKTFEKLGKVIFTISTGLVEWWYHRSAVHFYVYPIRWAMISSLSCSLLCISDTLSDDIIAQDQSYPNVPSHFAASEEEELTLPIKSSFWENIRNYKELDLTSFSKDFPLGAKILSRFETYPNITTP